MKKTILTLVMVLMAAFAVQEVQAAPSKPVKQTVQLKSDSVVSAAADRVEKVREKIDDALDDTLTTGNLGSVSVGDNDLDLTPQDLKEMSAQWASVAKELGMGFIFGLLGLVLLVLLFRFLNRRNKYRVMEKAIENNYPLNDLSLNDVKRNAIYVQQPVVTASTPMASTAQRPGQIPVGTPIEGQTPDNPIVMTNIFNWRALMPAIRVTGWGVLLALFGIYVCDGHDPFTYIGLALMFVGLCKGFILYKEQKELQEASYRAQQMPSREPMRQGIPVPPPLDDDYKDDDNEPYQPY